MKLRPYQQQAHDSIISWVKKNTDPCLIEAATGAGKSLIVSAVARTLHQISGGKHILCIQPSKELLEQNYEKFVNTGDNASMFSASVGRSCLRWPVVFGTPMSIKNKIDRFGSEFCAVIIDECHGITPTIRDIIKELQEKNKNLRIIGLTATPYRLGSGYIYAIDNMDRHFGEEQAKAPYFKKLVYRITAPSLIEGGYLTRPIISEIGSDSYDTINMQLDSKGKFDKGDIDRAYHGQGRKTSSIVSDVIERSKYRKGVIFFAATIQHANEIMESLPPELSEIITGETPKAKRENILNQFKALKIKYIVNVAVLTTGFDAPHVDVIALMRATESVGLLQQMIGRGLRIYKGKNDCLIMDYAQNIERHCPDGNIFNPQVKSLKNSSSVEIGVICPLCATQNIFTARKNPDNFKYDKEGFFLDLNGNRIESEYGHVPSHHGRRCMGETKYGRCEYRWTHKKCNECEAENDIAARYCCKCKAEIVDPNDKLIADFIAHKKDPTQVQTDEIIKFSTNNTISKSGNECIKIDIVTTYRSFSIWVLKNPVTKKQQRDFNLINDLEESPHSVTYKMDENGFYRILGFNYEVEEEPKK